MENEQERLFYLLHRYAKNECSVVELDELFSLIKTGNQSALVTGLNEVWSQTDSSPAKNEQDWESIYLSILKKTSKTQRIKFPSWQRIGIAASLLLLITVGIRFFEVKKTVGYRQTAKVKPAQELVPGGNKAILTLADGKKIILDENNDGVIASHAGITISKTEDGKLVYQLSAVNNINGTNMYNTIEVPKGGQYQVTMSDGTKIWLNAMSSLRYPINFKAEERVVELVGEGYFEVAKNVLSPFRVNLAGQTIEVLGTHFNVSSYENDHAIRTTLLEGAVKVKNDLHNKSILLSPGQQALNIQGNFTVNTVDIEQAIAWKNGDFMFNNDNLESIMRSLERWYDIEVEYKNDKVKRTVLSGSVSRFENASQVFDILELTGLVHFKVEGRRVIVM